ncbi:MAG: aminoacyl-histidine dipeptidase [Bacteroidota bacterium]|nr:aminoacyl-histidine dipeptidase [Bacteroidota bacterium]
MNGELEKLNPERLYHFFAQICKVPRPSKKEAGMVAYLLDFARQRSLYAARDEVGNVLIRKPACKGYENLETVVLQSHMDMVCEKNSAIQHDFDHDPIIPYVEGEWIKAKGTTLGADDGIGIAAQLAILDAHDVSHGPIECLFTTDEETGLTGAFGLKAGFLEGKILLNLDSEDEGQIFIGCAGGKDTVAHLSYRREDTPDGAAAVKLSVGGLKGGHSGDDINKGLGNAVKILNRLLWQVARRFSGQLSDIHAGNLRNAIAREGWAVITVPEQNTAALLEFVDAFQSIMKDELHVTDSGVVVTAERVEVPTGVVANSDFIKLLNVLYACPHGMTAMSQDIANFVETSTNLASVKMMPDYFEITTSQRSSVESAKQNIVDMVESVFLLAGASVTHSNGYPGWAPNPASPILNIAVKSYRELFDSDPEVLAIHAGLECGLIGETYPGMDMISFGPTIKGAHSPDERLHIPSVNKFWNLTLELLKRIPSK